MELNTLPELLEDELRDIYNAENQLVKALPKLAKKATSSKLKEAITSHLEETQGHVQRLNQIAEELDVKLSGKTCKAMQGLVEEGAEAMDNKGDPTITDAAIIGAAQRVEHYEMAAYGTARAMAEKLGHDKVVSLLQETLDEEKAADAKLTEISEKEILVAVSTNGDDDEMSDERRRR